MTTAVTETMDRLCSGFFKTTHTAYFILDHHGNITQSGGALEELNIMPLNNQVSIQEVLPFLGGVLPLKGNALDFFEIRTPDSPLLDAQLFKAEDGYGIILCSSGPYADIPGTARYRLTAFLEKLFQALDLAVLEMDPTGQFVLIGTPPSWIEQLPQDSRTSGDLADTDDVVNFLEHFIHKARESWQKDHQSAVEFDVWTLKKNDIPKMIFEAAAVEIHTKKLLIISQRVYQQK